MSKRIPIVDAQLENLRVIANILKYDDNSYEITIAPNSSIALKLIEKNTPGVYIK